MENEVNIGQLLADLDGACPAGYAIALHIKFATPRFLFQTYSKDWIDHYSQNGLVLQDPTVRWGFENTGSADWTDLQADDPQGVLDQARAHGLTYGFVHVVMVDGSRTVASFARADRGYTDDEKRHIVGLLDQLHAVTANRESLSAEEHAALKQLSINLTHS